MKWIKNIFMFSLLLISCGCGSSGSSTDGLRAPWSSPLQVSEFIFGNSILQGDMNGNLVALWGDPSVFFARRYNVDAGWVMPWGIGLTTGGWSNLRLAVSHNGSAVAAWRRELPGAIGVQVARSLSLSGWFAPEDLGDIGEPTDIATLNDGTVFVVAEKSAGGTGVTIARYSPGTGWRTDELPYAASRYPLVEPRIAINASGEAVIIWGETDGSSVVIRASHCTPAALGAPVTVASVEATVVSPTVAVVPNGEAMVLWTQSDNVDHLLHLYGCHYSPSFGWNPPVRVDTTDTDCIDQAVVGDIHGTFHTVWSQRTEGSLNNIYVRDFMPLSGWGLVTAVGTGGTARFPKIAAGFDNNVVVTWQQLGPSDVIADKTRIYANRHIPGEGWGKPRQLSAPTGGAATSPQVVVDSSATATVLWSEAVGGGLSGAFVSRSSR